MTIADYIQLGTLALAAVTVGAGALNRWAVANHRDRLAAYTSAAGNAAGRIRQELSELPPGADAKQVRTQLMEHAADAMLTEFDKTAPKIGATVTKTVAMIEGQLGQLPPVVASSAPSLGDVVDAVNEVRREVQQQQGAAA